MKILEEDLVNRRVEYRLIRIITLNQEYLVRTLGARVGMVPDMRDLGMRDQDISLHLDFWTLDTHT